MPSPRSYSPPAVSPIAIRQPTLGSVKMYVGLPASSARLRRSLFWSLHTPGPALNPLKAASNAQAHHCTPEARVMVRQGYQLTPNRRWPATACRSKSRRGA